MISLGCSWVDKCQLPNILHSRSRLTNHEQRALKRITKHGKACHKPMLLPVPSGLIDVYSRHAMAKKGQIRHQRFSLQCLRQGIRTQECSLPQVEVPPELRPSGAKGGLSIHGLRCPGGWSFTWYLTIQQEWTIAGLYHNNLRWCTPLDSCFERMNLVQIFRSELFTGCWLQSDHSFLSHPLNPIIVTYCNH